MGDLKFSCPRCNQHLESPPELAHEEISCPSCQLEFEVPGSALPMKFPININSSPRALYSRYVKHGVAWALILHGMLTVTFLLHGIEDADTSLLLKGSWGVVFIFLGVDMVNLWLDRCRILNTAYLIYPNKVEVTSYLFRFMGGYNSAVSLAQLRQIRGTSNSLLDVWCFKCGEIVLTVSGDVSDFALKNIYNPPVVKKVLEEVAFARESVQHGKSVMPEVEAGI